MNKIHNNTPLFIIIKEYNIKNIIFLTFYLVISADSIDNCGRLILTSY